MSIPVELKDQDEIEVKEAFSEDNSQYCADSTLQDADVALQFINNSKKKTKLQVEITNLDINHQPLLPPYILKKLDTFILPFLCAIYFLQFLDKTLLNYSAVMGIKKNLVGNEFANLGTMFNGAYIFGELFVSFAIQKFPLSRVLGTFIILWGIVLACHSACDTYTSLMIVRTLLGIFESSSAVGLILISGMYYNKAEQSARIGLWSIQSGTGTIAGGLLSFGFQYVHTTRFQSWQILFLVFGLITITFGVFVLFYLPDNVTKAWFLSHEEKLIVIEHIRSNQTGIETKKIKKSQIVELFFKDKFTYLLLILTITSQIITGAVGTFSTSITATFGFNNKVVALLQLPIGGIIIICILTSSQLVAKYGQLTLIHASMYIPSIVGAIMLISMDLSHKVGNLLGLYLLYSGSTAITLIYTWNSFNTAGYTKKVIRNASTMVAFALASIIGPQLFQSYSYPRYLPAKITILVTQCAAVPLTLFIGYMAQQENRKREILQEDSTKHLNEEYQFLDLTDIENKMFKYTY